MRAEADRAAAGGIWPGRRLPAPGFVEAHRPLRKPRTVRMSRLLIVEDQPPIAEALTVLFEIHDIVCEVAASPEEASARIGEGTIGVVLQDMNFAPTATSGQE